MASENAAARNNFVSRIYQYGIDAAKKNLLQELPKKYTDYHEKGYFHIHDLEAYGKVYNCSMPTLRDYLIEKPLRDQTIAGKINTIFFRIKTMIAKVALCQTGGIGLSDFDDIISQVFRIFDIEYNNSNTQIVSDYLYSFLEWINTNNERYCREPYYITLNIGVSTTDWGRFVANELLVSFEKMPPEFTRPNIVFKVSREINYESDTINHSIFKMALRCTAKKMIPTYLLLDSSTNRGIPKEQIGIMGCRTRVVQNINGDNGCVGRGNIANVSINLPRQALENRSISDFFLSLDQIMEVAHDTLLYRADMMRNAGTDDLSYIFKHPIWRNVQSVNELIQQGTLSIGFIGLSEAVEILTEQKPFDSPEAYDLSLTIVQRMRNYVDKHREKEKLNYSLLASPGELISGRFCLLDQRVFPHHVQDKGFYTNSFHMEVDAAKSVFDKIKYEAPFHQLCNGGAITYVEFYSAPIENIKSIQDIVSFAIEKGISYLGINYPMDICTSCSCVGTFDECPQCHSNEVKRIRRVSGYLEDLSHFTKGKTSEAERRKSNI